MRRRLAIAISVVVVVIVVAALNFGQKATPDKIVQLPNGNKITVEIADTSAKQELGLMFRQKLPEDAGMLFIFNRSAKHIFWMKNTLISLDMIWLDDKMQIVDITENVQPCKEGTTCPTYMPSQPAKYVLEVNAGFSKNQGLKVKDQLTQATQ